MKYLLLSLATILLLGLTANAAHLDYKAYRGAAIQPAGQGAVEKFKGIDFWSDGVPDRKYQIIGIIEDHRDGYQYLPNEFREMVSKKAMEVGADAIIIVGSSTQTKDIYGTPIFDSYYVKRKTSTTTRLQVIKYVQ